MMKYGATMRVWDRVWDTAPRNAWFRIYGFDSVEDLREFVTDQMDLVTIVDVIEYDDPS
jgi:hypothetical protein